MEAGDAYQLSLVKAMVQDMSVLDLIKTAEVLKQNGPAGAVESLYAAWIEKNSQHPTLFAVLFNYSVVLSDAGNLAAAEECLNRVIALNPDFLQAYINLGRIHERKGSPGLAIAQWSAAVGRLEAVNGSAVTHKTMALNQIARTLESLNQDEPAEASLRQSLEIDNQQREVVQHLLALRQRQCEWPVVLPSERISARLLMEGMSPLSVAAYADDPLLQLATSWNYNLRDVGVPAEVYESWPAAQAGGKLRIGYLSSDLREHAVGYLMSDVFGLHDRSKVEVFAYYCGPIPQDPMLEQFRTACDHWLDITQMSDQAAAKRMVEDGIQILVDLNGYTREARLKLVAMRPAPVIVNWLGYPGSMASPYHHYLIADETIIPEDAELYYSERVLRLPCYQPNLRARKVAPTAPTRADAKLPEDATVFCCFNGVHKLTRPTYESWLQILAGVPGSVLWLLGSGEGVNNRLRDYAAQRGIAAERIVFAEKLANPFHLARYTLADLFLDTTPYGAHTTASDALWAGVPVLTTCGRSFPARVCASLVRAAGLPELVCDTPADFVARAVALGNDRPQLQALRERLRAGRDTCILFDTPLLVRSLEGLFERMWQDYRSGALPEPDLRGLEAYFEVGCGANYEEPQMQDIADYHGWWRENLARRNRYRRVYPDGRLLRETLP